MVQDENDWLREELEDTERRLEEATSKLAVIQEEKKQWLFMEQVRNKRAEINISVQQGIYGTFLWPVQGGRLINYKSH